MYALYVFLGFICASKVHIAMTRNIAVSPLYAYESK